MATLNPNVQSQNRICTLFNIEYPIIQGGMVWCSGWKLAAAVSNAGGMGLLGAGSMYPDVLRENIRMVKQHTNKPFGVNLPLLYADVEAHLKIIVEEGVPIVFTSAGNPAKYTARMKDLGLKVAHVVANTKFARKCEEAGVDAIVAEGFEAGGHNGREETTTMVLGPLIRQVTSLPLILAGGIATGSQMLAAMILGADGIQMGSRFVASEESDAHQAFKQEVIKAAEGDTILTMKKLTPVRLIRNEFCKRIEKAEAEGATADTLNEMLGRARAKLGMHEGDLNEGELEIGQISALLSDIKPVAAIIQDIMQEYTSLVQSISTNGKFQLR